MRHHDFWLGPESENHITPGGEGHEGFDIGICLRLLCGPDVCDVGCGNGRMAPYFERYIGVDVSPTRIAACRERYPQKEFAEIAFWEDYPDAECYLFCNVLLHVSDWELPAIAEKLRGKRKVIVEVMNPERAKGEMCFHRKPEDYAIMGESISYTLPYERYPDEYTFLVFNE